VMLFLLIIMGSAIFVSITTLHVRKRAFQRKFQELAERRRNRMLAPRHLTFSLSRRRGSAIGKHAEAAVASGAVQGRTIPDPPADLEYNASFTGPQHRRSSSDTQLSCRDPPRVLADPEQNDLIRFHHEDGGGAAVRPSSRPPGPLRRSGTALFPGSGVGTRGLESHPRNSHPVSFPAFADKDATEDRVSSEHPFSKIDKYFKTVNGYISRNSQFHHLTERERKMLGGIEYDAICLLSWVVPAYFVLFQLCGAIGVGAWIQINRPGIALTNGTAALSLGFTADFA